MRRVGPARVERKFFVDPENPVVRLCVAGMEAEANGAPDQARELFERAWERAADDYEACIAAHYVARHQTSPHESLRWNEECLRRADRVGDERVSGFYPSLYLNLGKAHQEIGEPAVAHAYFVRAAERVEDAPGDQYGDWNRFAVAEGLRATAHAAGQPTVRGTAAVPAILDEGIRGLLERWCARAELKALGLTLPAYLGYLGTEADRLRLRAALHAVHASRWLPEDEQALLGHLVGAAEWA